MGSQLVIVALPSENDPVRQYSSEKEPHLTLLYLGPNKFDDAQITHITEYVEHAASQLCRFGLSVDSRGELGPQKADVLFFEKNWSRNIADFRTNLLRDDLISEAYLSTDQYPEWNPHLTMGFPTTPAKKDTREYPGFSYVNFSRVALWTSDYSGPTFPLKSYNYDMEVAMHTERGRMIVNNVIEHHGVKGMHWGVRKAQSASGSGTQRAPRTSEDTKNLDSHLKKIEKGGTRALTTKELQEIVTRMNLEQQYSKMVDNKSALDQGHTQVKKVLSLGQTANNAYLLVNSPGGKALRKALFGL